MIFYKASLKIRSRCRGAARLDNAEQEIAHIVVEGLRRIAPSRDLPARVYLSRAIRNTKAGDFIKTTYVGENQFRPH